MALTPTQAGNLGLGMMVAGAVSGAIASHDAAKSRKSSIQFQSDMAAINARIAELGAQSALNQGNAEVAKLTMAAGRLKSAQRTSMAANGIDLGEGNAAEVQASTDIMKEIDANQIKANSIAQAWGYRTQSVNYQNESLISRATASGINPTAAGVSSLINSAGSVASSWYSMNKAGLNVGDGGAGTAGAIGAPATPDMAGSTWFKT